MLRSIFPDEPGDDQKALADADTPGAFFAEFLPQRIKVPQAVSNFKTSFSDKHAPSGKPGAAADACLPAQQPSSQQQQQQKPTGQANGSAQPSQARQTGAAGAAADAKASAAAAATAAAAAAARAAKQAEAADKQAALRLKAKVDAAVAVQDEAAGDSESGDLLPSLSEIRSAMAAAWFGDEDEEGGSSSKERAGHKEAGEEEPSMLDRLMPFSRTGDLVPSFTRRRRAAKQKPLRLKLAEQVLPKEVLAAVQTVEAEILSAPDPLPAAIINFFLRAGRSMGTDWARKNANKVFLGFAAYVAATCGVMHGLKSAAKWLAWRIPRFGPRVVGPAVSFTADVLLPTPFFGPFVATYALVMVVIKQQAEQAKDEKAEKEAAEGGAAAATEAGAAEAEAPAAPKQQQVQVQAAHARSLELQFLMQEPVRSAHHRRLLRSRHSMTRATNITRGTAQAAPAAAAGAR